MRMLSQTILYVSAAAILLLAFDTASQANSRTTSRHHRSARHFRYNGWTNYGYGTPRPCAPFTRNKMNDAIIAGNSSFLSCGY
jgi:hypothetical protein